MNQETKIDQLIERLDRLEKENKEIKRKNKKLEKSVEKLKETNGDTSFSNVDQDISRRSFLRKIGAGIIGASALGLSPAASKLKISKSGIETSSGLDLTNSGSNYFKVNNGGPVEINNTDLRIGTDQALEDENGTKRVSLLSAQTIVRDADGMMSFQAANGSYNAVLARNDTPFTIKDEEGNFNALRYITSPSAPGSLELTDSNLIVPSTRKIIHPDDASTGQNVGLSFTDYGGGDGIIESSFGRGWLRFSKRSSTVGNNPPPSDGNTSFVYCESGELVAGDQNGNLTTLT